MNTTTIILYAIALIIFLPLLFAVFTRKNYKVERSIVINAPLDKVFAYVRLLKNQDNFNKWVMVDPDMKRDFTGTDGTVGFIYAWNGNKKAGQGEQEIKAITEGMKVETEIRFVRPMPGVASANMSTEALSENQTKVTWSNVSSIKYPLNLMIPMIEKMLSKDMDTSLENLKKILEA